MSVSTLARLAAALLALFFVGAASAQVPEPDEDEYGTDWEPSDDPDVDIAAPDVEVDDPVVEPEDEDAYEPEEAPPGVRAPTEVEVEGEPRVEADLPRRETELRSGPGLAVHLGGGVSDFVGRDLRDATDTGGAWDARLVLGTRSPIAFEAAYLGSAQGLDLVGVEDGAVLLSNGASGSLRVNLSTTDLQPYVTAGAGWRRFDVTSTDTRPADLSDADDIFEVPVAAGLAWRPGTVVVDLRGGYRFAFDDELVAGAANDVGEGLDMWNATLSLGVEF